MAAKPLLSMEEAFALVGLPIPDDDDSSAWRFAQTTMETWSQAQSQKARRVQDIAKAAGRMAAFADARLQRARSFPAKVERGEVCLPAWEQEPRVGKEFEVVDVLDGFFVIHGTVPNADTPWRYSTRTGRHNYRGADAGVLDVSATFLAWREFCAARKAKTQETGQ